MSEINEQMTNQLNRMKAMMNYGLKTEARKPYSSVEYERTAADGKKYGIIREGSKFVIKVTDKQKALKEDYNYIGGFQNYKNNCYDSYANALKHFEMKMQSLNEAYGNGKKSESWNVNGRDTILAEMSDKMRTEIARQREIMANASFINEGKDGKVCKKEAFCLEKGNIKKTKPQTGTATGQGGDFFSEKPEKEISDNEKNNIKGKQQPVLENVEDECGGTLGEEDEFETEDFDTVEIDGENDSTEEELTDLDMDGDSEEFEDDELESFSDEDEEEFEDDEPIEDEGEIASLRAEIESLRSTIEAMAEKLGVNEFDKDEPLYDDEDSEDVESDDDLDIDVEIEDEEDTDEDGSEEDEEDVKVFESRSYRNTINESKFKDIVSKIGKKVKGKLKDMKAKIDAETEDLLAQPNPAQMTDEELDAIKGKKKKSKKGDNLDEATELHDFGKHPRYHTQPMTLPKADMPKTDGQYEEGDDEDDTNKPYGTEIGDSTPFGDGEAIQKITNSIAESIKRRLLKNA